MAGCLLASLHYLYYLVKELTHAFARSAHSRHDGHTQQGAQLLNVKRVAALTQFVIHIERHNHRHIHVDELCGEVEVALQIAGIHHIDDKVGVLLDDVFPYIELLRRIS